MMRYILNDSLKRKGKYRFFVFGGWGWRRGAAERMRDPQRALGVCGIVDARREPLLATVGPRGI